MLLEIMRIINKIKRIIKPLPKFAKIGERCRITPDIIANRASNIYLGNNIYIGPYAILYCTNNKIVIKDHVIIGPRVSIFTANHNIFDIGVYIIDNKSQFFNAVL